MAHSDETVKTGGNYEFKYSKEDNDRIRNTDTESTKAFKKAVNEWKQERKNEKEITPSANDTIVIRNQVHKRLWKKYVLPLVLLLIIIGIIFTINRTNLLSSTNKLISCLDGTKVLTCSAQQPLRCTTLGVLEENPDLCGCPQNNHIYQGKCILDVKCSDGTPNMACSGDKPDMCINGTLRARASVCGCPVGKNINNEFCELN